jgi:hypothetical protein
MTGWMIWCLPPPTGDDPYEAEAYRLWAIKQQGK